MSPTSIGKRQREKARQEKAAAKAARRAERAASADEAPDADAEARPPVDEGALLAELADLHRRFDDGDIDFDDFTAAKDEITRKLQVD